MGHLLFMDGTNIVRETDLMEAYLSSKGTFNFMAGSQVVLAFVVCKTQPIDSLTSTKSGSARMIGTVLGIE